MRKILKSGLEKEEYAVITADNGTNSKDLLELDDFKAVISDVRMPVPDGLEILASNCSTYQKTHVVLMSVFKKMIETKKSF